ncbi:MAG: Asp23/Gls24 family envelope stress response protein, partial [Clostridiales bacterium]|nr:Asp23/Gls24 family envelope stress response protein [Clostridiales bacterium]
GYFSDPLDRIRNRLDLEKGGVALDGENERTMIRPTFSSLGSYSISDDALLDLIKITLKDMEGFGSILNFKSEKRNIGVVFTLDLSLLYGFDAQKVLFEAQQRIGNAVEKLTAITVVSVNIRAERLVHGKETT